MKLFIILLLLLTFVRTSALGHDHSLVFDKKKLHNPNQYFKAGRFKFDSNLIASMKAMMAKNGWASGGGSILRTAYNPWFMPNTKSVSYCVVVDEGTYGRIRDLPGKLVAQAFAAWKKEFAEAYKYGSTDFFQLATQNFYQIEKCNQDTDIRFYFGIVPQELKILGKKIKRHIGMTLRTAYDEKNLKGKGLVYIAPDNGPLVYKGELLKEGAWHYNGGTALYKVLTHELGHIFGIRHTQHGVMSDRYPEEVVRNFSDLNKLEIGKLPTIFNITPKSNTKWMIQFSRPDLNMRKLFGLRYKSNYILFSWQNEQKAEVFQLEKTWTDQDNKHLLYWAYQSKRTKIGEVKITDRSSYASGGVFLWNTPSNAVFYRNAGNEFFKGPRYWYNKMQVEFRPMLNGQISVDKRYFLLNTKHDSWGPFEIFPVVDGKPQLTNISNYYIFE